MTDFLNQLFDATGFMARGSCGRWTPFFRALAITNDALYATAYLGIPLAALIFWSIRREALGRYRWLYPLGAAFVFGCGVKHACEVAVWWWPAYKLYTVLAAPGALASIAFLAALPFALREWLDTPTAEEWRRVNAELAKKHGALEAAFHYLERDHARLVRDVDRLEYQRGGEEWSDSQEKHLDGLRELLQGVDRCQTPSP